MKRLVCSIVVAVTLTALGSATLPAEASSGDDAATTQVYLVVLRQAPIASYQGGLLGYAETAPSPGARLDLGSADAISYRAFLTARQASLLTRIGDPTELYSYTTALNGFAALLTAEQAKTLQVDPQVLLVSPDTHVTVDASTTTDPAATLAARALPSVDPTTSDLWGQVGGPERAGRGVVVGVIDTGVWPDNPSLAGNPTSTAARANRYPGFTGICQRGPGWTTGTCSSKVIAARYFVQGFGRDNVATSDYLSPRDGSGHGTSVAAIAAGNAGVDTRIDQQDFGHISGLAPGAALSVYKACWTAPDPSQDGCDTADTVAAIDRAVADGVDVINYSIGDAGATLADPVQLAFLNATIANVFVATSAGNGGPTAGSVQYSAPWLTTTGANTRDVFEGGVHLGSGPSLVGAMLSDRRVGPAPLVYARDVAASGVASHRSALCYPGSLDAQRVEGAIVVCDRGVTSRVSKSAAVAQAGGRAMVLANTVEGSVDADLHQVPTVHLDVTAADQVKAYIAQAGTAAMASFEPGATDDPLIPVVADFSGRGPTDILDGDVLKPDLTAPGVSVISAVGPPSGTGQDGSPARWDVESGTSIATAHVAGVAAVVGAAHPTWSPAAIKSAMMSTAQQLAGTSGPLTRGAGQLDPTAVLSPGLVYDTPVEQWIGLLDREGLRLEGVPRGTAAAASDVNAASIALGDLVGRQTVTRTVTNVGKDTQRYTGAVTGLPGVAGSVTPNTLTLGPGESASFSVTFTTTQQARYDAFVTGALTWSDSTGRIVASPVVVRPELTASPAEVAGSGRSGTLSIESRAGVTGTVHAFTSGLVGSTPVSWVLQPGSFDPSQPAATASTAMRTLTIPTGTRAARFQVRTRDGGDDVDLYVYRGATLVASAASATGDETVTLSAPPAGAYRVYVTTHQAAGLAAYTNLTSWVLPRSTADTLQLDRHGIGVNGGESFSVAARWAGVDPGQRWWGYVGFRGRPGVTYVTVN